MLSWLAQGSGIIIIMAWGRDRPANTRNSRQLSNMAESDPSVSTTGRRRFKSSPKTGDSSRAWRACIQLMLPRRVLISPLWMM
jgi:hypothetical protein